MLSNLIQFFYNSQETNDSSSLLKAIVMFDEQVFLKKYALSKTVFGKELKSTRVDFLFRDCRGIPNL